MVKKVALLLVLLLTFSALAVQAQEPVELRITWYDDGNEGEVLRDLLDRFEAENPDIRVVIDTVAYNVVLEQLPLQVEVGEGPDMARITNFEAFYGRYLDLSPLVEDAAYWEESFPPAVLEALRNEEGDDGIYGFPNQFTVSAPYINRTLFEQAGVEVPSDVSDEVTWTEWTEAAAQVAEATGTPYAIAIDRSGHRLAGPIFSTGGVLFPGDDTVTIDTPASARWPNCWCAGTKNR
ncbi:MAG: carbohydrate ABC transporter substrate-binding protein [Blastochloris sp.]|nr:carbohydrate ABC transporter substrate-binding protein [Blastochloris sp.]